jgi:hypothetical protein
MTISRNVLLAATLTIAALPSVPAAASVTLYTDEPSFLAAVTAAAKQGFSGIAPVGGIADVSPTVAGVTFTSNNIPFVIDTGSNASYGVPFFSGQGNADNVPANSVTISFTGYQAFGFHYGSYISTNESYTAVLNTGDVFNFATAATQATPLFLGFVSTTPLTSITLTSTAGANVLDPNGGSATGYGYAFDIPDFTLANPAGVPEPMTWAMMTIGFGALGATARYRKRARPIAA